MNGNGKKRKEKGARAGPIHGPMITMIKDDDQKLGSNRVVEFDGRLDVLNLLRNLCAPREQSSVPKRLAHRVTGPRHGSELHRSICGAGAKAKPGRGLVGDPQNDLQPIKKMTKREMQTK